MGANPTRPRAEMAMDSWDMCTFLLVQLEQALNVYRYQIPRICILSFLRSSCLNIPRYPLSECILAGPAPRPRGGGRGRAGAPGLGGAVAECAPRASAGSLPPYRGSGRSDPPGLERRGWGPQTHKGPSPKVYRKL